MSRNYLRHRTSAPSILQAGNSDSCVYTCGSVRRASGFVLTGNPEGMPGHKSVIGQTKSR